MIIDCVSDLHGSYPRLEGGDLLIVAGDLTAGDSENEVALFDYWLHKQNYAAKIVIGGNHDNVLQQKRLKLQFGTYLEDSGCAFNGLKIWGSPWTNWFDGINPKCTAFVGNEQLLASKFALIPDDTNILITHGPPHGIMDQVKRWSRNKVDNCGSQSLSNLLDGKKIRPKLHVFGHIHEGYGQAYGEYHNGNTLRVNCSIMNENYDPINKPIRVIL